MCPIFHWRTGSTINPNKQKGQKTMHNITNNGQANIAYTGSTPWHKLGQKIDNAFDADTALKEANLDWEVDVHPLYHEELVPTYNGSHIKYVKSIHGQVVKRRDNGDELGVVGKNYSPLQNKDAFAFFDGLFGKGQAKFETAGYTGKGERVWLLANMQDNDPIEVLPNDVVNKYMLLTNPHGGKAAVIAAFTPIRVVCQNTLTAAVGTMLKDTNTVRVVHKGNVADRLQFAGSVLAQAGVYYDEVKHLFQSFAKKQLTGQQVKGYIHQTLFNDLHHTKSRESKIEEVEKLMYTGRGSDIAGVRGTVWGVYNALTEYVDHVKTYRGQKENPRKQLEASQFGTGRIIKNKALLNGANLVGYSDTANIAMPELN